MKNLIDQSGLVAGSDYLSLSRTMVLKNNKLIDSVTNAKHRLNHKAAKAIGLLELTMPYELWRQYNYQIGITDNDMLEIILFLNSIGALQISRSNKGRLQVFKQNSKRLLNGLMPILRVRRRQSNFMSICMATIRAMLPLIVMVIATALLAYGINLTIDLIIIASCTFLITIWFSTVIHEWIHRQIIAKKCKTIVLLQRGMRLGILHKSLPTKIELVSAFFGPIAGAVFSITINLIFGYIFDQEILFLSIGILVAVFQLFSFLPAYGDGQIIWKKLKENLS